MIAPMPTHVRRRLLALLLCLPVPAFAAQTVRLPGTLCPDSPALFRSGFEVAEGIPSAPSGGSGGAGPGDVSRTISVPGLGNRTFYLRVPAGYTPARSWPLLFALHGTSGSPANAIVYAQQVRGDWSSWADARGFLVLAPVGNQAEGGWGAYGDVQEIGAALDDTLARYNIETSRVYLWGFSSGAHFGHTLALNNPDVFAAYGTSAGSLEMHACTDDGSWPPTCAALLAGAQPKIPVDIHIGTSDPLMQPPYTATDDPQRFRDGGWRDNDTLFVRRFVGGHSYSVAQLGEIWRNLCPFALVP